MVWSSSHAHHGNEESSYRKLLPTHIISQLVHLNHNQSQTDLRNGQVNSTVGMLFVSVNVVETFSVSGG